MKKFMKKYFKKALLATAIIAALCIGYAILHAIATAERHYNAVGGEIFIFLLPYIISVAIKTAKEIKAMFKGQGEYNA